MSTVCLLVAPPTESPTHYQTINHSNKQTTYRVFYKQTIKETHTALTHSTRHVRAFEQQYTVLNQSNNQSIN